MVDYPKNKDVIVLPKKKFKYNTNTQQVEPMYENYNPKENILSAQTPQLTPPSQQFTPPSIDQMRQEAQNGMPNAGNNYAMPTSGDPFMDKIKGILAQGAPAVTNTQAFQEMLPTAYAGNKNLGDLQKSYEQQYRDFQIKNARPGYTDQEIANYIESIPAITEEDNTKLPPPPPSLPVVEPPENFMERRQSGVEFTGMPTIETPVVQQPQTNILASLQEARNKMDKGEISREEYNLLRQQLTAKTPQQTIAQLAFPGIYR